MQEMLDKGYRVLLYGAQFDLAVPVEGLTKVINSLTWKGADDWKKSERKIWRVNGDVAGYIKISGNFAYAMIRNAGNYAIRDQPVWALDLVERFLYNKEF
jgi:vitellogenic carboxypeptidase-like protein